MVLHHLQNMNHQRKRRFKSVIDKKLESSIKEI